MRLIITRDFDPEEFGLSPQDSDEKMLAAIVGYAYDDPPDFLGSLTWRVDVVEE